MPKKLILCRHALANPSAFGVSDFERPLSTIGRRQAEEAKGWLDAKNIFPDLVVCSAAIRTLQTGTIIAGFKRQPVSASDNLYNASYAEMLQTINQLENSGEIVLLVGHNPGISALASELTGIYQNLEPCQLLVLSFLIDSWAEVSAGTASLLENFCPEISI